MKKSIFLVMMILMSCAKKDLDKPKLETALAVDINAPQIYIDLAYFGDQRQLNVFAYLNFPLAVPADIHLHSARIQVSGMAATTLTLTGNSISWTTGLNFASTTTESSITVKIDIVKGGQVISSGSQTIRVLPLVNSTSAPENPTATVTLKHLDYDNYYITASHLEFLANVPGRSVDFYAFYFPDDYQRYTLMMKPVYLGKAHILGQNFFPTEGGFQFRMPANTYDVSNIRVFITQSAFPLSYFTSRLRNIPNEDYLIDWCQHDTFVYMPLTGLDNTNIGRFSNFLNQESKIYFIVGSMDQMLNTQIYYLKDKGWLW